MFEQLLGQGWFGCSIVGTSNSFCPDDMWSFGMPMLILLVLAAAGLALPAALPAAVLLATAGLAAVYVAVERVRPMATG